jgi:hypothetical protein
VGADISQVGSADQRIERIAGRVVVEVADHGDQVHAGAVQAIVNFGDPGSLTLAPFCSYRIAGGAEALGLEVVDQHYQRLAARRGEVVFAAVPAEDDPPVVGVEDVGPDRGELVVGPGQDADIDPAVVVAVDEHDLVVRRAVDLG